MIYAEKRKEDSGTHGYFTLRYFVWNGDNMLGTYGVHYKPWDHAFSVPYGASRDYHRPATEQEIEARKVYDAFNRLPDEEQDKHYDAGTEPDYTYDINNCIYWANQPCVCDGSSLVEVTTDDKRAFEIAAMMAGIDDREVPVEVHPVHEHDCEFCTFIGSYRLKHPYTDDEYGYRTRTPGKQVDMGDVYLACGNSSYKYIVRYGIMGEYATTNTASRYVLAPMVDGIDPYERTYLIFDECVDPIIPGELTEDLFKELG